MEAKPLDKGLIRKIRFGKKNIRTELKIINFDPRSLQERNHDDESFKNLCGTLQNCLPASSFFLFHDIKSNCASSLSDSNEETEHQEGVSFTDNFDIATSRFKTMVDEHVSSLTVTGEEIENTERLTKGSKQK